MLVANTAKQNDYLVFDIFIIEILKQMFWSPTNFENLLIGWVK